MTGNVEHPKRTGANAFFPFIYSHEPHRAGVVLEGARPANFHGGNYARPHMQFYQDTPLTLADMTAPEFGGMDVLERVKRDGLSFLSVASNNATPT